MKTGVKTQMNKKTLTLTIAILVTASLSIAAYFLTTTYLSNYSDSLSISSEIQEDNTTENNTEELEKPHATAVESNVTSDTEEPQIIFTQAQMAYDASDTKVLLENRDHVFVGNILERIQDHQLGDTFYPVFRVEVLSNIKGEIKGSINLIQGGIYRRGSQTFVTQADMAVPSNATEDDILLKEGATYVFVSNYSDDKDLYGVGIYPYDRELISTKNSLSTEEVLSTAKQNPRVQEILEEVNKQGDLNEDWR